MHWIKNYIDYVNIEIISTSSTLSPIYLTNLYQTNGNTRLLNSLSICFYPDNNNNDISVQFNFYNMTNNDGSYLASYTMNNINGLNLTGNESPMQFEQSWENITKSFNISAITHIPRIRYNFWISSSQCMEITTATMYFGNDYNLNTKMYRLNENNQPTQITTFQTSKLITFDSSPTFNSIFCLPGIIIII